MSIPHILVIISTLISIAGASVYIKDTIKGKSKPNRVSWSMWALSPLVATAAALSAHADLWVTIRIFLAGFIPLLIVLVSFVNPKSYWKITRFDVLCGVFSFFAFIAWLVVKSFDTAILLAVLGDFLAAIPTIKKAWEHPETETGATYIASFIAVLLIIPSIPKWDIVNSAFQVYLIIANALLLFSVYRKRILYQK